MDKPEKWPDLDVFTKHDVMRRLDCTAVEAQAAWDDFWSTLYSFDHPDIPFGPTKDGDWMCRAQAGAFIVEIRASFGEDGLKEGWILMLSLKLDPEHLDIMRVVMEEPDIDPGRVVQQGRMAEAKLICTLGDAAGEARRAANLVAYFCATPESDLYWNRLAGLIDVVGGAPEQHLTVAKSLAPLRAINAKVSAYMEEVADV